MAHRQNNGVVFNFEHVEKYLSSHLNSYHKIKAFRDELQRAPESEKNMVMKKHEVFLESLDQEYHVAKLFFSTLTQRIRDTRVFAVNMFGKPSESKFFEKFLVGCNYSCL
jgi:hypothetical protein